jgi:transcriptional regulator with XRE-family HTH domain
MALAVRVKGSQIREARLSAGMTQAQLARAIQTTEKNISRWESDLNQPRVSSVVAIAKATGRDLDFFLTGSAEADEDEETSGAMTLDDYLRVRVRQILAEERSAEQRAETESTH